MEKEYLIILAALIYFILGFFVYLKNKKNIIHQSFFLFTISLTIWAIALFFYTHPFFISALEWIKITYFLSFFTIPAFFLFFPLLSGKSLTNLLKPILAYVVISLPFILAIFNTNLFVKDVISKSWGYYTITGPIYPLYGIFVGVYVLWGLFFLLEKFKKSKGIEKLQIRYILLGIGLSAIFTILPDIIFPIFFQNSKYFWISTLAPIFFVFFTFLAILRYHLFEIKVILTEILVGIMGILLLILPLLMPTPGLKLLTAILFLLFCVFGYLLISYTHQEIKRREEIEQLSDQLQVSNIKLEAALQDLTKSYDELKQLDDAKTMFLSIASHQLRTPLSAMKGYLSMVLSGEYGTKVEGQVKDFLLNVYQSNERLIGLVNDILDITRLQMGKMQFNFQPTQLEDLVQGVVEELKPQIKQKNISLEFQKPRETLPKVKLDPQKFRQVILNLIDNALKYTEKGKILISLYQKPPNSVLFTVKDTGIGMEKEELDDLFQLFERGADAVKTNAVGVGIGLYASREIVKAHQGKIWAESEGKGKGSTFYVEIPVK